MVGHPDIQNQIVVPPEFALMMESWAEKVEQQRIKKTHLSNGELVQPILDQMQDELHIYFTDYCNQELDFLLLFQLKKLVVCIEIFCLTLNNKG